MAAAAAARAHDLPRVALSPWARAPLPLLDATPRARASTARGTPTATAVAPRRAAAPTAIITAALIASAPTHRLGAALLFLGSKDAATGVASHVLASDQSRAHATLFAIKHSPVAARHVVDANKTLLDSDL